MATAYGRILKLDASEGLSTGDIPLQVKGILCQGILSLNPQSVATGENSPTFLFSLADTMDYTYISFNGGRKFPHGLSTSASSGAPTLIVFLA